jgi:21S rRNA (GM2251-2'-O)-methyltransferase
MVALDRQTREDREVNGTRAHYPYKSSNWRHPFVLYVDGVVGSVDSIHRTKLTISA